nr:hypothetical protein [uncultured Desulfobulbus sp.]
MIRVLLVRYAIVFLFAGFLAVGQAFARSDCECYRMGKSFGASKQKHQQYTKYDVPSGCGAYIGYGQADPWAGGFYDGRNGRSEYNDKHRWCGRTSSKRSNSGGGFLDSEEDRRFLDDMTRRHGNSGSGNHNSRPRSDYRWVVAQHYAQPGAYRLPNGRCPRGSWDEKGFCVRGCERGFHSYTTRHSAFCVKCPGGTEKISLDHRGVPICGIR